MVAETTLQPGGFAPPLHLHREIAEVLYLLSGRLELQVGDDHRIAVPGTFVGIPSRCSTRSSRRSQMASLTPRRSVRSSP